MRVELQSDALIEQEKVKVTQELCQPAEFDGRFLYTVNSLENEVLFYTKNSNCAIGINYSDTHKRPFHSDLMLHCGP